MTVIDSLSGSTQCTSAAWLIQAPANVMEEKSLMETSWHSAEACSRLQSTRATWALWSQSWSSLLQGKENVQRSDSKMASFVAQSKTVNSFQNTPFKTYPLLLSSATAQLWQLPTQLPSTNPTPGCQISSIPLDHIWVVEIPLCAYNSGAMTFSIIMSKSPVCLAIDQRHWMAS